MLNLSTYADRWVSSSSTCETPLFPSSPACTSSSSPLSSHLLHTSGSFISVRYRSVSESFSQHGSWPMAPLVLPLPESKHTQRSTGALNCTASFPCKSYKKLKYKVSLWKEITLLCPWDRLNKASPLPSVELLLSSAQQLSPIPWLAIDSAQQSTSS